MPTINGTVTEKWTKALLPYIVITLNGNFLTRTNSQGWFTGNVPTGVCRLCVIEEGKIKNYEENCQTINIVSNTTLNIQMTPIFRAL